MFRLLRWLIGVAALGLLVYVGARVPMGDKTLWEHLRAIAGTSETQQLVDGVKQKAGEILDQDQHAKRSAAGAPADELTPDERAQLRKIIRERVSKP